MRDYQLISPSLDGVLYHDSLAYDGVTRPLELLRVLDGPRSKGRSVQNDDADLPTGPQAVAVLERYFNDLYGVFLKKLSAFIVSAEHASAEDVKLQAILQEMIKVKKLISQNSPK